MSCRWRRPWWRWMMGRPGLLSVVKALLVCLVLATVYLFHVLPFLPFIYRHPRRIQTTGPHPCVTANMTVLTAFFDIGTYTKAGLNRSIEDYFPWAEGLAYLHNPLVLYTDSDKLATFVTSLRSRLHPSLTTVVRADRKAVWPFQLRDDIAQLYAREDYPKHHPNTVLPEYTCAQHSKYACLEDLIVNRPDVQLTETYAWVDFGYFFRTPFPEEFCMVLPEGFDLSKPSYNEIFPPDFSMAPRDVFYQNEVWLAGGFFVATRDVMLTLCREYRRAALYWLHQHNLSDTDQQNLYASFTWEGRKMANLSLQLQAHVYHFNWFGLGHSCRLALLEGEMSPYNRSVTHYSVTWWYKLFCLFLC